MPTRLLLVAIAFVSILSGTLLFTHTSVSETENSTQQSVRTVAISPLPFQETATFSGFVRGARQADIAPKISGAVVKLFKEEGDTVRQGEPLALLEGSELGAARQSALLSLEALNATIKESERYYNQKVDEAKTAVDQSSSAERKTNEEALKSAKRFRAAQLAALHVERAGLEGTALVSETNAARLMVRAPFSGIIVRKQSSLGSFITAGSPIYTIAAPDALEVAVSLPASMIGRVNKDSSVIVSSDATLIEGSVFSIASAAEEASQRGTARIHFPPSTLIKALPLGRPVLVTFTLDHERTALLVPEMSILSAYDDTFVYLIENGIARRHSVIVGNIERTGSREIISGLNSGDHLVVEGQHALVDNQPVVETYVSNE